MSQPSTTSASQLLPLKRPHPDHSTNGNSSLHQKSQKLTASQTAVSNSMNEASRIWIEDGDEDEKIKDGYLIKESASNGDKAGKSKAKWRSLEHHGVTFYPTY